ncbi:MAG: hypothetical protein HC802_02885 [Caldilineaceae bacterium]|nr:hypothetical protein [Caldilineaceae bacterium]
MRRQGAAAPVVNSQKRQAAMHYQIALDPALELPAEAVVQRWNSAIDVSGVMTMAEPTRGNFDPGLAEVGLLVVSSISINLFSSLIYDTIKALMMERGRPGEPKIEIHETPDGRSIVVVTIEKYLTR